MRYFAWMTALAMVLFVTGCGDSHEGHAHGQGEAKKGGHSHAHTAPHGGVLVELGEHEFNLELVRDAAQGKLTVYVLDAHAENFVRVQAAAIEVVIGAAAVSLKPVANTGTGETVGNTSQFEAVAEIVKQAGPLQGQVGAVEIKGRTYSNLKFTLP